MGTPRRKARISTPVVADSATADVEMPLASVPLLAEIVIDRAAMRRALVNLTRVADKRSHLPVLSHVYVRTDGQRVTMTATDLSVWLTLHVDSGKPSSRCALTTPAHVLSALVRTLPEGDVALRPDGAAARVECGPVRSRIDAGSAYDYPKIPTAGDAAFSAIDGAVLREAMDMVRHAMSCDETRRMLNGVLIESTGDTLTVVATDGHRLSVARRAWSGPVIDQLLVPRSGVDAVTRFPARELAIANGMMFLRAGEDELAVKLTDDQFPPYRQVIPVSNASLVTLSRDALVASLERARLFCSAKRGSTRGVTLEMDDGALAVSASNAEGQTMCDRVAADYIRAARVGLNPVYLLEALSSITEDTVTLALGGELDPITVRSMTNAAMHPVLEASVLHVIMPMRI